MRSISKLATVRPACTRLRRLVMTPPCFAYNKTRDFMRKVSAHVSIGAAYEVEKSLDHYFILVRER